jgi:hypothetical protein
VDALQVLHGKFRAGSQVEAAKLETPLKHPLKGACYALEGSSLGYERTGGFGSGACNYYAVRSAIPIKTTNLEKLGSIGTHIILMHVLRKTCT